LQVPKPRLFRFAIGVASSENLTGECSNCHGKTLQLWGKVHKPDKATGIVIAEILTIPGKDYSCRLKRMNISRRKKRDFGHLFPEQIFHGGKGG